MIIGLSIGSIHDNPWIPLGFKRALKMAVQTMSKAPVPRIATPGITRTRSLALAEFISLSGWLSEASYIRQPLENPERRKRCE